MIFAQCHTNRNYGGLQILSVVCYILYQTDLVICFNIHALNFSHGGGGGDVNMYQFHQMHTQIYMTLTQSNLIVRRIRMMVLSRILKKMVIAFKKGWLFLISFYPYM